MFSIREPRYELDIEMVEEVVARAKTGKAAGLDKVCSPDFTQCFDKIFQSLAPNWFYAQCILHGFFPIFAVFPIPKISNMGNKFSKITHFKGCY